MEKNLIYTKDCKNTDDLKGTKKILEDNFENIPIRYNLKDKVYNKMRGISYDDWKEYIKEYYIEKEYNDILNSSFVPTSKITYIYDDKELVGIIKLMTKDTNYIYDHINYDLNEEDALVTLFYLKDEYYKYVNLIIKEMEKELPYSLEIENLKYISNGNEEFLLSLINNGYSSDTECREVIVMKKRIHKKEDNYARQRKPKWNTINK